MNENKPPAKRILKKTKGLAKPSRKKEKRAGKSIRWMVIALLIAVAFIGWTIAAASYASDIEGWSRPFNPVGRGRGAAFGAAVSVFFIGLLRVLWNAIVQIPNAHRVAWHTFTEHSVMLTVTALFAGGVCLFGWWMRKLERQFEKEDRKFRRVAGNE